VAVATRLSGRWLCGEEAVLEASSLNIVIYCGGR